MKWIVFGIIVGMLILVTLVIGVLAVKGLRKMAQNLGITEQTVRELEAKRKLEKLRKKRPYVSELRIAELEAQVAELQRQRNERK